MNLTQASVLSRSAFLSDIVQPAKKALITIDNENFYQGTKVRGIAQEKEYLENMVLVICKIVTYLEE